MGILFRKREVERESKREREGAKSSKGKGKREGEYWREGEFAIGYLNKVGICRHVNERRGSGELFLHGRGKILMGEKRS